MNSRELSRAIAQRLPDHTQDDVMAVLDIFVEIVREELTRPHGYIYLHRFGRLHVDHHFLQPSGIFQGRYRRDWTLLRLYFRFTPTLALKNVIRDALDSLAESSNDA